MTQPTLKKLVIGLSLAVLVIVSYGIGQLDWDQPDTTRIERVAFEKGARKADRRYEAGVAAGRDAFRPGSAEYQRIYDDGVAAGRSKARAATRAAYEKELEAAKADVEGDYNGGHVDGYNEGYEEGYDAGSAGEPFDDSDNDSATSTQGDNDDTDTDTDTDEYGDDRPDAPYDLDCADFDGPVSVSPGDPHDLDRDGDGIGCDA
jgi:hypothetical protein